LSGNLQVTVDPFVGGSLEDASCFWFDDASSKCLLASA